VRGVSIQRTESITGTATKLLIGLIEKRGRDGYASEHSLTTSTRAVGRGESIRRDPSREGGKNPNRILPRRESEGPFMNLRL